MLVLSRKLQQQIKIGEQITVTILRVTGNTVRVGIQAPRDVRVLRGELPKEGAAHETIEEITLPIAAAVAGEATGGESSESLDEVVAGPVADADCPSVSRALAHLPLRRIKQRFGAGPLAAILAASSAALAK